MKQENNDKHTLVVEISRNFIPVLGELAEQNHRYLPQEASAVLEQALFQIAIAKQGASISKPIAPPDEPTPHEALWHELLVTYRKLAAAKPNDRSEKDRRYAVAITKYQDVLAWVHTMIVSEFEG